MAQQIPARLTIGELRKFGLLVGGAFIVLGGLLRWKGAERVALTLWIIGGGLMLAGLLIPGMLGPVYRGWMGLALLISRVTTPIIMGVLYFVVITPMGLVLRAVGHRPLARGRNGDPVWVVRDVKKSDLERQF